MKNTPFLLILTAIAAAIISSCSTKTSVTQSSYSIYVNTGGEGYFVLDDSTKVYTYGNLDIEIVNGQRAFIYWLYDESQATADPMHVELTAYELLSQAATFQTNQPDTLGTAGADLVYDESGSYMWKCGGVYNAPVMLTLSFYFATSGSYSDHYVFMTYTDNPIDSDDYFHLHFSHNPGREVYLEGSRYTQCSFVLPKEAYQSGVKGVILDFDGMDGTPTKYKFTYSTAITEKLL